MTRVTLILATFLLAFSSFSQNNTSPALPAPILRSVSYQGITGKVMSADGHTALPARIVITDANDSTYGSYYKSLPGFFSASDGSFEQPLPPGSYQLHLYHSIDYVSQVIPFTVEPGKGVNAQIFLEPWSPLQKEGWVCGDGHDHLYTDKKPDTAMAATLRKICLAQGIDFVCAAQGWAGYNDSNWRKGYADYTDDHFTLYYGSEMPKYRTGHTWWLGQKSTRGYFWSTMDTVYENLYFQAEQGTKSDFTTLPFPFIPDVYVVDAYKKADHAVAITAHPTSWWWQQRGSVEKYATNVAVNLPFGLLSGKIWDGLVVMGYNHDHYFYQYLWFHVLNEGFRMPALSELDGGFEPDDPKYYGSMRTYYEAPGKFSIDKITGAVQNGRTFVTSGPIILADVDHKYKIGDIVRTGVSHNLHIRAYARGERDDYLSYIIVFRNGEIFKLWDLRDSKPRSVDKTLGIDEKDKGWYIVKVYGKHAPYDPADLDVMKVCDRKRTPDFDGGQFDVALTSPFYFWPEGASDPKPLMSKIHLKITPPQDRPQPENVTIDVLLHGKKVQSVHPDHGVADFTMPVNGLLKITADGYPTLYRTLYLDYPPERNLVEDLSAGNWLKKYDSSHTYHPGEVPWEAFHFEETRQVLSNVDWTIEMTPNERDGQWERFEGLFKK